jgi:hypothetical protein
LPLSPRNLRQVALTFERGHPILPP